MRVGTPSPTVRIPTLLKTVIALFFAQGLYSLVKLIIGAVQGVLALDIGIVCIFIGFGLLRLSRGWQIVALLYIAIVVVLLSLFIGLAIVVKSGVSSLTAGALLQILLCVTLGIGAWRVLTRGEVHQLFVGAAVPEPRSRRSRPVFDEPEGGIDGARPGP
jgi:hypothetical protein